MTTNTTTNETGALRRVPVSQIKPGINPRTRFDEDKLRELGATLLASQGPVQPVIVYLDDDGLYGLIAGERRWRASKMVGMEELEVILRAKPNAKDARKIALLENMQRENLTPLEIAWAVRDQLAEKDAFGVPVYTKTALAEEMGEGKDFVTWCESLLRCSERLQQAVHEGRVEMRLAAIVGSLPPAMHEMAEREMVFRSVGPMPVNDAGRHVAENYRRDLRKAQFDQKVAGLIEGAPPCANCEMCGANRNDVQGKHKASTCLNVACYDAKQATVVAAVHEQSDNGHGVEMLGEDKRETVFSFDGVTVKGESGYVAADDVPDGELVVQPQAKRPTWREILDGQQIKTVKIVDGEGQLRTLYDAKLAVEAATAEDSAVKTLFKRGATVTKNKATSSVADNGLALAQSKAKETGLLAAGVSWVEKIRGSENAMAVRREVTRLLLERVTEVVDRQWMAGVFGVKDVMERVDEGGSAEVLALALVARSLRLQGPGSIGGISGDLCKLTGFKPAQEAKAIEALVAAAVKTEKKRKEKCPEDPDALTESETQWLNTLWNRTVPVTKPNEHGVHPTDEKARLLVTGDKRKAWMGIGLAKDERGRWMCSNVHESKMPPHHGSGSSPASVNAQFETRSLAIVHELTRLLKWWESSKHEGAVAMVKRLLVAAQKRQQDETLTQVEAEIAKTKENGPSTVKGDEAQQILELVEKAEFTPPAKQRGGKREKNEGAEKKALAAYLKTGSIAKAAEACGLDVESVKNWHKRRGWKALREAHLAK